MGITENAAYLKGLAEGLELDTETKEGKIILKMLDVISEMAEKISVLESENDELYDYVAEMAKDIVDIENDLYLDDEDDYEDYSDLNDEEDFDFDDEEDYYEIECPSCGEKICFTDDIDIDTMVCPACGDSLGDVTLCDGECEGCDGCEDSE